MIAALPPSPAALLLHSAVSYLGTGDDTTMWSDDEAWAAQRSIGPRTPLDRLPCSNEHVLLTRPGQTADAPLVVDIEVLDEQPRVRSLTFGDANTFVAFEAGAYLEFEQPVSWEEGKSGGRGEGGKEGRSEGAKGRR